VRPTRGNPQAAYRHDIQGRGDSLLDQPTPAAAQSTATALLRCPPIREQMLAGVSSHTTPRTRTARAGRGRSAEKAKEPFGRKNASRAGCPHGFSIFGILKIAVFLSGATPMIFRTYRRKGFNCRPRALRRAVLSFLESRPGLTTKEIAGCAYCFGGPIARPGWRIPNESELQSTYRALRHLVSVGKIANDGRVRRMRARRGHKTYSLAKNGVNQ
jgi:hypothetical protein